MAPERGLFDENGPAKFADAIRTVATNMGDVNKAFEDMGSKATAALAGIKGQLADIAKLSGQVVGTAGQGAWAAPAGAPNTGQTGGSPGNSVGVGGAGAGAGANAPQPQGTGMPQGTARYPGNMATRAAESFLPLIGQAASGALKNTLTGMQQSVLLGSQYSQAQPGGYTSGGQARFTPFSTNRLGQSQSDIAVSSGIQYNRSGVPTQNLGNLSATTLANQPTLTEAVNAMQQMLPGTSAADATSSVLSLYTPQTMRALQYRGIALPMQNGIMSNLQVTFEQLLNGITSRHGDTITTDQFKRLMSDNGAVQQVTAALGGDPNLVEMFSRWGVTKTAYQTAHPGVVQPGGAGQPDFLSNASLKAGGYQNNAVIQGLLKNTKVASAQSEAATGVDIANQTFDKAVGVFAGAVKDLVAGPLGTALGFGGGILSHTGNVLGGLVGLSMFGRLVGGGGAGGVGAAAGAAAIGGGAGGTGAAASAAAAAVGSTAASEFAGATAYTVGGAFFSTIAAAALPAAASVAGSVALSNVTAHAAGLKSPNPLYSIAFGFPATAGAALRSAVDLSKPSNPLYAGFLGLPGVVGQAFQKWFGIGGSSTAAAATNPPIGTPSTPLVGPIPGDLSVTDQTDFAKKLLPLLGAPTTPANVASIVAWEGREGGHWHNPDKYNPLNTTLPEPGSKGTNSVGVQAYTSWTQGMKATVDTLTNGLYADILGALKSGKGLSGGHYPGLFKWSNDGHGGGYDHLARGSWDVARTELAMLHKGERVIPAAENYSMAGRYSRQAQGGSGGASVTIQSGAITVQAITLPNGQVDGLKTGQAIGEGILAKLRSS